MATPNSYNKNQNNSACDSSKNEIPLLSPDRFNTNFSKLGAMPILTLSTNRENNRNMIQNSDFKQKLETPSNLGQTPLGFANDQGVVTETGTTKLNEDQTTTNVETKKYFENYKMLDISEVEEEKSEDDVNENLLKQSGYNGDLWLKTPFKFPQTRFGKENETFAVSIYHEDKDWTRLDTLSESVNRRITQHKFSYIKNRENFGNDMSICSIINDIKENIISCGLFPEGAYTPQEYGKIFISLVNNTKRGEVLQLPNIKISVPSLTLKKAIIIQGSPGTSLEITDGSIVFDFEENEDFNDIGIISELSITFTKQFVESQQSTTGGVGSSFDLLKAPTITNYFVKDGKRYLPLFLIRNNCSLEIRDCLVKSLMLDKAILDNRLSDLDDIYDIAVYAEGNSMKKNFDDSGLVSIRSSSFMGFKEFVHSGKDSIVSMEKCNFSGGRGTAVSAINPKIIKMVGSTVDKALGDAVELKFIKTDDDYVRKVYFEGNTFAHCMGHSINMSSEGGHELNLSTKIYKNRIYGSRKNALQIKQITLAELEIAGNEIVSNKATGVWMQNVQMSSPDAQPIFYQNRCNDSTEGYGIYLYDTYAIIENCDISKNNTGGIMIIGSKNDESKVKQKIMIIKSNIKSNKENGLFAIGFCGSVTIHHSRISDNSQNGIIISHEAAVLSSSELIKGSGKVPVKEVVESPCSLTVKDCEVVFNQKSGIQLNYVKSTIIHSSIRDNQEYAIFFPDTKSKNMLSLVEIKPGSLSKLIKGRVGGPWGEIYSLTYFTTPKEDITQSEIITLTTNPNQEKRLSTAPACFSSCTKSKTLKKKKEETVKDNILPKQPKNCILF